MVRHNRETGFSLLEVLMCLTMLALIMLPFTLTMGTVAKSTRGSGIQSTRTLLLNSLRAELTPTDPSYVTNFTDAGMNTSVSDTGQVMPYRRSVDATTINASNSFKRTTLLYLYGSSADASSAALYRTTSVSYPKAIRMHFGTSTGFIDTLGRYWYGNSAIYNSGNKIPGLVSAGYGYNDYSGNTIINTSGNDHSIYAPERASGSLSYSADVENGPYTVKIFLSETYGGITSTNRRLINFYLEGVKMNTDGPFSTYDATGGTNRAMIMMYDVNVTDGTLNFTCSIDATSNDGNCNLHSIEVIKRTL